MTTSTPFPRTTPSRTRRPQWMGLVGRACSALCILLLGPGVLVAQHADHGPADQAPGGEQAPTLPLFETPGTLSRTISTSSPGPRTPRRKPGR